MCSQHKHVLGLLCPGSASQNSLTHYHKKTPYTNCTHGVKAGLCVRTKQLETIPFPETSKTFINKIHSLQNINLLCRTTEIPNTNFKYFYISQISIRSLKNTITQLFARDKRLAIKPFFFSQLTSIQKIHHFITSNLDKKITSFYHARVAGLMIS